MKSNQPPKYPAHPENPVPTGESDSAREGRTITLIGVLVNGFLIVLKLIAGSIGHSQALIADAIHSVSDLFTDAVVLFGLRIGRKAPDEQHHFGHARIETLTSALVGLILIGTAVYIGFDAGRNIYFHTEYHPTALALIGAVVSILCKETLYHYTVRVGRRIRSAVIVANAWHHRSDALSSVAVLIGVAASLIKPSWHILDAYAALFVSIFIVKVAFDILREPLKEFVDTAPERKILDQMTQCALAVEGVEGTHDLRVRTAGGLYQVEIHVLVDGCLTVTEGHRIAKQVEYCLEQEVEDVTKVIVHVDPAVERKN